MIYDERRKEIKEDEVLQKAFTCEKVKVVDKEKRLIDFTISTAREDRMGDVIMVNGWDLNEYKKNPVVLFGHDSRSPPIGKTIKITKSGDSLKATAEFMTADVSPFADSIFKMYEGRFLRATSVGFRPLKWERLEDEDGEWTGGFRFLRQELLEFSAVPIPANPDALVSARSKGIDTAPIKSFAEYLLDDWKNHQGDIKDLYGLNRKDIENIRKKASGAGLVYSVPQNVQDELLLRNLSTIRSKKESAVVDSTEKGTGNERLVSVTFEINGKKHSLSLPPATNSVIKESGEFEVSIVDDGNKKFYTIEEAPDVLKIDTDIFNTAGGSLLEVIESEGKTVLVVTAFNKELKYELTHAEILPQKDSSPVLYAKLLESTDILETVEEPEELREVEETEVEEQVKAEASDDEDEWDEDEDEDDKAVAEMDEDEDEDEDEDDKAVAESEEKEPEKIEEPVIEEPVELSIQDSMALLESVLVEFEDKLDSDNSLKGLTRHEQRRVKFLASVMLDLAGKLDPTLIGDSGTEKASPVSKISETKAIKVEEVDDVDDDLIEERDLSGWLDQNLVPTINNIVERHVNKLRGRLED